MFRPWMTMVAVCGLLLGGMLSNASASVLGHHAFSWWDDPQLGVLITPLTPYGQAGPTPTATHLLDLREWHLDQAQTTQWYNGTQIAGLPTNPFATNPQIQVFGQPVAVTNAEAFIYELTNWDYWSGNGLAQVPVAPFTFTTPNPPGPGVNDLSGINIVDRHGALNIASPVLGSQFMYTELLGPSKVLDLTPTSVVGTPQDWDFNAFSGAGNFEWDIRPANGAGVVTSKPPRGLPPAVFGYAMPGHWLDAVNDGWVHSWNSPPSGAPITQVNIANSGMPGGFSGPRPIPEPASLVVWGLLAAGGWLRFRRRKC